MAVQFCSFAPSIVVYSTPQLFTLPGGGGDASGFLQLLNEKDQVIQEIDIGMVQQIEKDFIYWSRSDVYIQQLTTCELD